jgi:photosystem II stability/assembly factor-like uncharacterized protein
MLRTSKKIFLSLLLVSITFSFSGCMGIPLPGESTKTGQNVTSRPNDSQGVFKSIDGGKTWQQRITLEGVDPKDTKAVRLDQIQIGSMAMDPQNNKILYLGTLGSGFYKTENGGDSWYKIKDGNGKLTDSANIYDIAIEKGNPNIIYIATLNVGRGVLLKSDDGGKTWNESYIITEAGKQVNRVQIDPVHSNIVYIGTEQGGFIQSGDRGVSWKPVKWFPNGVKDFIVDFKNSKGIIVLTAKSLFKTVDGGADEEKSWEDLSKKVVSTLNMKVDFAQVSSMTIDNQNPLVVYMTYLNLILVTKDGGNTWQKMDTITPSLTPIGTAPNIKQIGLINDIIYYGAGNALYKSDNKGLTWSSFDIPIKGDVRYTISDYTDKNIIYVGAFYTAPKKK